jgi:hypothetical protein
VPVISMPDTAAMSLSMRLGMILPLPMLEDSYFHVVVYIVLHFKVYPLA